MIKKSNTQSVILLLVALLLANMLSAQRNYNWDSLVMQEKTELSDSMHFIVLHKLGYLEREELYSKNYIDKGYKLALEKNNVRYKVKFLILNGEYEINSGNYSKALDHLHNAIKVAEKNQLYKLMIHANYDIGVLHYQWKNYTKSEKYVLEAIRISEEQSDTTYLLSLYNGIGSINSELNRHDVAKKYMLKNMELSLKKGTYSSIFLAYSNLGIIYNRLGVRDSALYYHTLGKSIARAHQDTVLLLDIYTSIARFYGEDQGSDSTEYYVSESLKLIHDESPMLMQISAYDLAYEYFKLEGESDTALYYAELYYNLKDSLFDKEKLNKITDLETSFETERYQVRIKSLEQENKIKSMQLYGSIGGLILFLLILVLSYRSYKLKANLQKQNRILAEEKAAALRERMEFQQRDSATNALYIVKQNKIYDTLIKDLKKLSKMSEEEKSAAFQSLILDIQKSKKSSEKKDFEIKFKRAHQDFYKNMKTRFPELTKKDLDLCAYLKLNMSTKEIASLTNASIRSIEVSRSRLRKKLNVESGVNLSEFIRNI
jgi:DNA-binding CsgD family transcriptional regulator